jgi:hypothetical protein
VRRQGEVEDSAGRVAFATRRVVVVPARQLAPRQAQTYTAAQVKAAGAVMAPATHVHAQGLACEADATAAIAEYAGRGQGRRGRRPRPWRSQAVRDGVVAETRRVRRARRGRPAKPEPPPTEVGCRLTVEVTARATTAADNGGAGLATTVPTEVGADAEMLQVEPEQNPTADPGCRWSKNPAAIAPVWREKPDRMAAWAMLTVVGWLVYSGLQRQVRLDLRTHDQQIPGTKGLTATPTAAVVWAVCAQLALGHLGIDEPEVAPLSGVQPDHLLVCDAPGLDSSWSTIPSAQKNGRGIQTPWTWAWEGISLFPGLRMQHLYSWKNEK